jgi:hypothetical protein
MDRETAVFEKRLVLDSCAEIYLIFVWNLYAVEAWILTSFNNISKFQLLQAFLSPSFSSNIDLKIKQFS